MELQNYTKYFACEKEPSIGSLSLDNTRTDTVPQARRIQWPSGELKLVDFEPSEACSQDKGAPVSEMQGIRVTRTRVEQPTSSQYHQLHL